MIRYKIPVEDSYLYLYDEHNWYFRDEKFMDALVR